MPSKDKPHHEPKKPKAKAIAKEHHQMPVPGPMPLTVSNALSHPWQGKGS